MQTASASKSRAQELLQKAKQQKSKGSKKKQPKTFKNGRQISNGVSKTLKKEKTSDGAAREQPKEKRSVEVKPSTPEKGSRRQSRRLAEQQKMRQEAEQRSYISVGSDSCSDENQTPQKKKKKNTRRKDCSCALPQKASSQQNSTNAGRSALFIHCFTLLVQYMLFCIVRVNRK